MGVCVKGQYKETKPVRVQAGERAHQPVTTIPKCCPCDSLRPSCLGELDNGASFLISPQNCRLKSLRLGPSMPTQIWELLSQKPQLSLVSLYDSLKPLDIPTM